MMNCVMQEKGGRKPERGNGLRLRGQNVEYLYIFCDDVDFQINRKCGLGLWLSFGFGSGDITT